MSVKWKDPRSGKWHTVSSQTMKNALDYLVSKKPGDFLTWVQIGEAIGMSLYEDAPVYPGRNLVRRAVYMLGLEYLPVNGVGIELVCRDTYKGLLEKRTRKMCRAARRAHISATNTTHMLGRDLSPDDRSYINNYRLMCEMTENRIQTNHELIESEFSKPLDFRF